MQGYYHHAQRPSKSRNRGNPVREKVGNLPSDDGKPKKQTKKRRKKAMARERMVTRTVFSINYNVMVVNMKSKSVESISVTIPSADTMTDKAREKAIKAMIPEGKTFVTITGETTSETLYGMTEAEFIRLARVLPPRTKTE